MNQMTMDSEDPVTINCTLLPTTFVNCGNTLALTALEQLMCNSMHELISRSGFVKLLIGKTHFKELMSS